MNTSIRGTVLSWTRIRTHVFTVSVWVLYELSYQAMLLEVYYTDEAIHLRINSIGQHVVVIMDVRSSIYILLLIMLCMLWVQCLTSMQVCTHCRDTLSPLLLTSVCLSVSFFENCLVWTCSCFLVLACSLGNNYCVPVTQYDYSSVLCVREDSFHAWVLIIIAFFRRRVGMGWAMLRRETSRVMLYFKLCQHSSLTKDQLKNSRKSKF